MHICSDCGVDIDTITLAEHCKIHNRKVIPVKVSNEEDWEFVWIDNHISVF